MDYEKSTKKGMIQQPTAPIVGNPSRIGRILPGTIPGSIIGNIGSNPGIVHQQPHHHHHHNVNMLPQSSRGSLPSIPVSSSSSYHQGIPGASNGISSSSSSLSNGNACVRSQLPTITRFNELFEALKCEYDNFLTDLSVYKSHKDEFEAKIQSQIHEMSTMQHHVNELEKTHIKMKNYLEEELSRLSGKMEIEGKSSLGSVSNTYNQNHGVNACRTPSVNSCFSSLAVYEEPNLGHGLLGSQYRKDDLVPATDNLTSTLMKTDKIVSFTERGFEEQSTDLKTIGKERKLFDVRELQRNIESRTMENTAKAAVQISDESENIPANQDDMTSSILTAKKRGEVNVEQDIPKELSLEDTLVQYNMRHPLNRDFYSQLEPNKTRNEALPARVSFRLLKSIPHDSVVCSVAFSPDLNTLVTGVNKQVHLYSLIDQGLEVKEEEAFLVEDREMTENYVASGSNLPVLSSNNHKGSADIFIRSMTWSPDGSYIACGGEDGAIRIWNRKSQKLVQYIGEGEELTCVDVYAIQYSPDGKRLAAGFGDGSLRIWSINQVANSSSSSNNKDNEYRENNRNTDQVFSMTLLHLLSVPYSSEEESGVTDPGITSIAFCPSQESNREINLADFDNPSNIYQGEKVNAGTSNTRKLDHEFRFNDADYVLVAGSLDKRLTVWRLFDMHQEASRTPPEKNLEERSDEKELHLKNQGVKCIQSIPNAHSDSVYAVAFSSDAKQLVSGGLDRAVRLWTVSRQFSGYPKLHLCATFTGHLDFVLAVAFLPGTPFILSGSKDRSLLLWDTSTTRRDNSDGEEKKENILNESPGKLKSILLAEDTIEQNTDFSKDSQHSINPKGTFRTPVCLEPVCRIRAHKNSIISLALNPSPQNKGKSASLPSDTFLFATGSGDRSAKLWQVVFYFPKLSSLSTTNLENAAINVAPLEGQISNQNLKISDLGPIFTEGNENIPGSRHTFPAGAHSLNFRDDLMGEPAKSSVGKIQLKNPPSSTSSTPVALVSVENMYQSNSTTNINMESPLLSFDGLSNNESSNISTTMEPIIQTVKNVTLSSVTSTTTPSAAATAPSTCTSSTTTDTVVASTSRLKRQKVAYK